jgi:ferrous iron transport protein A
MPLTLSRKGERSSIKHIGGPGELKKRLETLGFTVGSEVTVVSELAGNLIVNVKDSRVAISREMATLISDAARSAPSIIPVKKELRLSGRYREKW